MTGEWITNKNQPVQKEATLPNGTKVYMVQEHEYTKMATSDGKSKNYIGPISSFDPAKWDTYNTAPDGVYKVNVAQPAAPPPPPAPAPSAPMNSSMSAGAYSASCNKCTVMNNQITCACDVVPQK